MPRATWDETWRAVAEAVALRSACSRAQVGAVVVDANQRLVASGYNGPPSGLSVGDCPREAGGLKSLCTAIHAEANALLWGDRREREGGTIYVTRTPCRACALLIANSGLARVVFPVGDDDRHATSTIRLLRQAGLAVDWTLEGTWWG